MKRRLLFLVCVIVLLAVYFILYHKNKELKYIPDGADAVVLIDVKNFTRKYLSETVLHPSVWLKEGDKKAGISWKDAGIKIPDFVQLFHLKNEGFSNWYMVLEIKNRKEFESFLKDQNFQTKGNSLYTNGNIFLKINGEICIAGTSQRSFETIESSLKSNKILWNADDFMTDGIGSLGIINGKNRENYSIHLNDENIEISNFTDFKKAETAFSQNINQTDFLTAQLEQKNIQTFSNLFKTEIFSHPEINSVEMNADLKQITDTIISYDYDDNFNEVEKVSYQKIVQPQYLIQIKTKNSDEVWNYFEQKKFISPQNQFTAIPFLPNKISRDENGILINTVNHPKIKKSSEANFILIKNNPLLLSSFKSLSPKITKKVRELESVLYWNDKKQTLVRFQFKSGNLPLILR
ncbi:hypothetical protein [Chryseobacterium caseinilyticum]|uniref:DUF4340 domain-containing protein n=1 Tax=Chryseobacterium caseinilyticum TaxID=2771428 RepID=A0ABR8ZDD1_9FLAO|nr:hypothetical protein [Chryseobacterium caseinilyticum]MBD8082900.1 hypothetical protein [Chryseobacterium caseinilyticum]